MVLEAPRGGLFEDAGVLLFWPCFGRGVRGMGLALACTNFFGLYGLAPLRCVGKFARIAWWGDH